MLEATADGGYAVKPQQLRAKDFGVPLPNADDLRSAATREPNVPEFRRQAVLLETLAKLEEATPSAHYHALALRNLKRWAQSQVTPERPAKGCVVHVLPGDWGDVTLQVTQRYGKLFASLNMANAYGPGGGYTHGMVAQEENMFRRTDCHFSLLPKDMDGDVYTAAMSSLLNAEGGRVYLDVARPRVCIRGAEERAAPDLGYRWLAEDEVFPFLELRAAAVDLRDGARFSRGETARRVGAQLDTLIEKKVRRVVLSAFGCGAFCNPAAEVAQVYAAELSKRADAFDVVAFAIFHAGYGPNNFAPFEAAFGERAQPLHVGAEGGHVGADGGLL